ncbi:MAG: hypothetical protein CME64_06885 [Halobacteriovoraceae bacterium]|nr:hypothetical protein [Halobacteriovoraceae bacterium]|tara:strand:- start:290 stop:916 length:627 start_codon:yes stop_codon:yes gene_type:complete
MNLNKLYIYLETKRGRTFVGTLKREANNFSFTYDEKYFYSENPIQVGPELSLKKRKHHSKNLFGIFLDRIPSRQNPAYTDYCKKMGIKEDEDDVMILLSTLGARGPSSFVVERDVVFDFSGDLLKEFRKDLRLSMREFSKLFDISLSSVQKIESGKISGKEVLKRIEIYFKFPEVAAFEVKRNKREVHSDCYIKVMEELNKRTTTAVL